MSAPSAQPLSAPAAPGALPHAGLDLTPVGRRPPKLQSATERAIAEAPVPAGHDLLRGAAPAASVVVVSYDNLLLTKLCVAGVLAAADEIPFELIVVDNHSTDGSAAYLRQLERDNAGIRVILNDENRGFGPANNAALAAATGGTLVLLNNDTVVPPGWLAGLMRHLGDPGVGLVGPVTNRIGNEAEIETAYRTYGEMLALATDRSKLHRGESFDIPVPCMFCLAMRRDTFERVGPLDERFEVGMLEDDDYARRTREAGLRLVCAADVFVHHFGQGSFGKLVPTGEYMRLLEANQRRYLEKWGEPWKPYGRRASEQYDALVRRVREVVERAVPAGATAAVVSKGDDALLLLPGRRGVHYPCAADGTYAGCYPADGAEAVALLEDARALGAEFLVLPETSAWWLGHYPELAERLGECCRLAAREPGVCDVYDLRGGPARGGAPCG